MSTLRSVRYFFAPLMLVVALALPCVSAYAVEFDEGVAGLPDSAQEQVVRADASALPEACNLSGATVTSDNSTTDSTDASGEGADNGSSSTADGAVPSVDASAANGQSSVTAGSATNEPKGFDVAVVEPSATAGSDPSGTQNTNATTADSSAVALEATEKNGWDEQSGQVRYYDADGVAHTGWLVTNTYKSYGLQRYWFGADGLLTFSQLIDAADAGWWAYATEYGYVVRGRYTDSSTGYVYFANNDGRLEDAGWHVSNAYGQGLQRYWIDSEKHAAVQGFSTDGWAHYTTSNGYVLRGGTVTSDGSMRYADNDGRLQESGWLVTNAFGQGLQRYWIADFKVVKSALVDAGDGWWTYARPEGYVVRGAYAVDDLVYLADNDGRLASADGWLVTNAFGQGLQRYWIDSEKHAAVQGFSADGWAHYTTSAGYVLRGGTVASDGSMRYADNDGRLQESGWLVTNAFGQGLQRYWIADFKVVKSALVDAGNGWWAYARPEGYVVRGAYAVDGLVYLADNDGRLASADGWLVTNAFGQGLQRYWIDSEKHAAVQGFSTDGWDHYTTSAGYVVRGLYTDSSTGYVYLANNDGRLENPGWVVSSAYGQGLQRYWVDAQTHACVQGFFTVDGNESYTTAQGYVLRGSSLIEGRTWYADNDGKLFTPIVASASVKKSGDATNIESTVVGDTVYLFLPSYVSLEKVPLAALLSTGYTGFYIGNGEGSEFQQVDSFANVNLKSIASATMENGALVLTYKVGQNSVVRNLAVMLSSDVASVFVLSADRATAGRAYIEASADHSAKASVAIVVVDPEGTVIYNKDSVDDGKLSSIKGRGNASWGNGNKKPYQISLNKKSDLLQTGDSANEKKKWVLLANANDVTLLHDTIAYNLALEMGMTGVESRSIDLWYDGEYRGSYLLCEKIEVNSGRVDIHDLESDFKDANKGVGLDSQPVATGANKYGYSYQYVTGVADPEDITGGYLLELDSAYYAKEKCYFFTSHGVIVVKSPEVCSENAMKYISEAFQAALNALDGEGEAFSFDLETFAKAYLLNEFAKNSDFGYSSTYYYLDKASSSIFAAPVWDFDRSMGTNKDLEIWSSYSGYMGNIASWMLETPSVQKAIKSVYNEFSSLVHNVLLGDENSEGANGRLHSAKYYLAEIAQSQKMDEVVFGLAPFGNCLTPYSTYTRNIEYLTEWLENRIAWMDDAIPALSGEVNYFEPVYGGVNYLKVFDVAYYKQMNPDVVAVFGNSDEAAFQHFIDYGMREGRIASRNFNVQTYKSNYTDLRDAFGDDLATYYRHYIQYGFYEGRYA